MKFSIATPVFNGMPWLPCCLNSVSDQNSDKVQIEHLVHDGGSTDGSLEILKSASNIICSSEPDDGMYDAINRCWRQASGEICAYLNCDEQYLPGVLAEVAEVFEQDPGMDMLLGDALLLNENGKILSYRRVVAPTVAHTQLVHLSSMSCAMFFRRQWLEKGFFFDTRWKAIGDAEWMVRLLRAGIRIKTIPQPLAAFGITGANLGANPRALEEAARWRVEAGRILPGQTTGLRVMHWLKKALAGAYKIRDVQTSLYIPSNPAKRTSITQTGIGHKWTQVDS